MAERRSMNWDRFGLDNTNVPRTARVRATGGFVDLGSETENTTSGAHPSGADEVFANEQGEVPWWRSNFFISQPILFGKWDGVFTTTMVNIFGVIVFLRSGWIVAQAGILNAILVIVCTVSIALVSVLSAIGIVERIRVETGGVYFLIANTLGSRFGGSLGLLYCFGQAVGCALNVLGFGESICGLLGLEKNEWAVRGFAIAAILLLATINVAGVKWVIKLQFLLLICLLLSALDFMVGSFITEPEEKGFQGWGSGNFILNMRSDYDPNVSWFGVFGIFFPTITGVLSGINMSGDLRSPTLDIPNGTLAALSTSTFLYMTFIIFLGATVERETLRTDYMIASRVSAINFLLLAGIYVSSTSSALGCMYGTPRVLQSIAKEATVPKISLLERGKGPNKVPLNAMLVVASVVIVFIMVGDINSLAPIVTIPFIFTYACIDYSYFALAQTFDIQTKREERYRIQAQSPLYETRSYGATTDYQENDLDQLFPDRVRHKNLTNGGNQADQHEVIIRNPTNSTNEEGSNADDEPIHPIRQAISQKTKNWYSGFCNRWASILGAGIKIFIMFLVNWYMAILCLAVVFIVWFYVGTVNIGKCIPGIASEFRFFVWLKNAVFQCFGKKVNDYEQVLVTPHLNVDLTQSQLNDENEDFSSRRRYHQTLNIQGQLIDA